MNKNIKNRLAALREKMNEKELHAFFVLSGENRFYLSGFNAHDGGFDESAGALLITGDHAVLMTDSRFIIQAEREAHGYEVIKYANGMYKILPELFKRLGIKKVGFESTRMSCRLYELITDEAPGIDFKGFTGIIEDIRAVKDTEEILQVEKALEVTETVFQLFRKTITSGVTEKEAAWRLEKMLRENGADCLSFPTITAFGENSAMAHAVPGDRKLKKGEPALFDFGIKLNDYCSDITRVLYLGDPDEKFLSVYNTVLKAAELATKAVRPGIDSRIADDAARSYIREQGYEGKFGHSLGHGIGLAVHEEPKVGPIRSSVLESGMIFTIEPGIYLPDWGGVRLENMAVVTNDGVRILNSTDFSYKTNG